MPELPEVETIRRDLEKSLLGRAAVGLIVRDRRLLSVKGEARFRQAVMGQSWIAIGRKGKYLTIDLANGWQVIFHLRMTGQLVLLNHVPSPKSKVQGRNPAAGIPSYPETLDFGHWTLDGTSRPGCRMLLQFDHGAGLAFYDQRRFGEVFLTGPGEKWPGKTPLGPDPLNGLNRDRFISMVRDKTARIKPLLMDQRFLSGVGNIYAQESLFKAGVRPARPSCRLSRAEAGWLYDALRETLLSAIAHRGSTSRNYLDAYGRQGSAQDLHAVYRRGGEPCLRCEAPLRAIRVGGRGTVFCPKCQR